MYSTTYRGQCPQYSYVYVFTNLSLNVGVVRYKWRGHVVWLSHELLMEMEVVTLYCFVGGSSMQTGVVHASEVRFLQMLKMVLL